MTEQREKELKGKIKRVYLNHYCLVQICMVYIYIGFNYIQTEIRYLPMPMHCKCIKYCHMGTNIYDQKKKRKRSRKKIDCLTESSILYCLPQTQAIHGKKLFHPKPVNLRQIPLNPGKWHSCSELTIFYKNITKIGNYREHSTSKGLWHRGLI